MTKEYQMEFELVLKRWLPILSHGNKIRINYIISSCIDSLREEVGEDRIGIITNMKNDLGVDTIKKIPFSLPSCLGMYVCIIYISMVWYNERRHMDRAYYLSLLYIDLDYTIDNVENSDKYVKFVDDFLQHDMSKLKKGMPLPPLPEGHKNLVWYRKMVGRDLNILSKVIELFQAEVQSGIIQRKRTSRNELKDITIRKAGKTAELMCAILEIDNKDMIQDVISVGYIAQLMDDLYDLDEDKLMGINTLITHEVSKRGNVDRIVKELIVLIGGLHHKYNFLRIILLTISMYIISRRCDYISTPLLLLIDKYTSLDYRYNLKLEL
jgi:hypothetical protein